MKTTNFAIKSVNDVKYKIDNSRSVRFSSNERLILTIENDSKFVWCDNAKEHIESDTFINNEWIQLVLRKLYETDEAPAVYKVKIFSTKESTIGISYWVCLENSKRPKDTSFFDPTGTITPFKTPNLKYALHEALEWAEFFGVEMEPYVLTEEDKLNLTAPETTVEIEP